VTTALLLIGLVPLVVLRVATAAAETAIAVAPASRRRGIPEDAVLASAARACTALAAATAVGIVTTVVWTLAGRGWVPALVAVVVPALLVVADVVPRGLAVEHPARARRRLDPLLAVAAIVVSPVLLVERALATVLLGRSSVVLPALRRLGGWLASRRGVGPFEVSEAGLVARIARFAGKTARDAMVSQVDVCAVADTASVGDVIALVEERGFSRIPVFHERLFNVIGVVSSLDLLGVVDPGRPVGSVMREPLFVPESKPLPELLATLQAEGRNLALVVDEYGGFVGLVTVEDLVEEIVGEIQDEYDAPREHYRRVAPGVWIVSARAPVTEVNERFGWNLPQGEYETLSGLVLERLGRVPKPGDRIEVGRVRIEVTRATARAMQELRVTELRPRRGRGR
jgi:magnesium and cobalt exporter, CNNM family